MSMIRVRNDELRESTIVFGSEHSQERGLLGVAIEDCRVNDDSLSDAPGVNAITDINNLSGNVGSLYPGKSYRYTLPSSDRIRITRGAVCTFARPDIRVIDSGGRYFYKNVTRTGGRNRYVVTDLEHLRTAMRCEDCCAHNLWWHSISFHETLKQKHFADGLSSENNLSIVLKRRYVRGLQ